MTNKPQFEILDTEEQGLEMNFEALGTYPNDVDVKEKKRITIRIASRDLEQLKCMVEEEGLAYQAYITSLLHKVSIDRLQDTRGR